MGKVSIFNDLSVTQIHQLTPSKTKILNNTYPIISLLYLVIIHYILYNI